MSNNPRPLTTEDIERIPADAARLYEHVRQTARPDSRGIPIVVAPRPRLAHQLGITPRQLARAEAHLLDKKAITVTRLLPRNEHDAAGSPRFLYGLRERDAS